MKRLNRIQYFFKLQTQNFSNNPWEISMLKNWKSLSFLLVVLVCFSFQGHSLELKSFEWGPPKSEKNSLRYLKERWAFSLLQECLRSKVEKRVCRSRDSI